VPQSSSAKSYSWNHDTAHFRPVDFDYQVYIRRCKNSSDGKLFACWSSRPSLGFTNWPTCLQVFSVLGGWNCPLTYTDSTSSFVRLIALWSADKNAIRLYRSSARSNFGSSMYTHGVYTRWIKVGVLYELILQDMRDGWVMGRDNEPLFWVSVEQR